MARMARPNLPDLPEELLGKIFANLYWGPDTNLLPCRQDLANLSRTCKQLRESVVPTLFHTVTLRLRWEDDALIEPGLCRLRVRRPDLARLVRCVHLKTDFEHKFSNSTPFAVPEKGTEHASAFEGITWTESFRDAALLAVHKGSVIEVIQELYKSAGKPPQAAMSGAAVEDSINLMMSETSLSHEEQAKTQEEVRRWREEQRRREEADSRKNRQYSRRWYESPQEYQERLKSIPIDYDEDQGQNGEPAARRDPRMISDELRLRLRIDALVVVVLSMPMTVTKLVVESCPSKGDHNPGNNFALSVAAMALHVFGKRLKALSVVTRLPPDGYPTRRRHRVDVGEGHIITPEVIQGLTGLCSLILASDASIEATRGHRYEVAEIRGQSYERWHTISISLVHLELWYLKSDDAYLLEVLKGFGALQELVLKDVALRYMSAKLLESEQWAIWLRFMITLRRQMPDLEVRLVDVWFSVANTPRVLPQPKAQWLMESLPAGLSVEEEKERSLEEAWNEKME